MRDDTERLLARSPAAAPRLAGPPHPLATPAGRIPAESGTRVEIQALRALAMSAVVLYHVVPSRLTGGYVGVDVFFVVSGFLITGHLLREVERSGRVQLARFWARRARRLLPASLLVLLVSALAVFAVVPQTLWQQFLREIGASAVYLENWVLAGDAVDYLAHTNVASPAQHYWSLSTEEQFYLLWPLLILVASWVAARSGRRRRTVLGALLGAIVAASLAYSWWATAGSPPDAYFTTPSRAWEFGVGGLLAFVASSAPQGRDRLRSVVSWAGFAAIGWSVLTFTEATPFPGSAALVPVLGTVGVIWAGAPRGGWSTARLAGFRPVRFVGDISYSAYLWHWPLVVILPYALGHPAGARVKLAILGATLVAAWATKKWVEDPVRSRGPLVRRRSRATFLATAVASAAMVAVAAGGWLYVDVQVAHARAAATAFDAGADPCFGAGAMDGRRRCSDPYAWSSSVSTAFAKSDLSHGFFCLTTSSDPTVKTCRFGSAHPATTVALLGDSHTASLYEAMDQVAREKNWAVVTYLKTGCPALGSSHFHGANQPWSEPPSCGAWGQAALREIAADPAISQVFTSYRSDVYKYVADDGSLHDDIPAAVVQDPLRRLADAGKTVNVLRAIPSTGGVQLGPQEADLEVNQPDCIAQAGHVPDPCSGARALRLTPDRLAAAAVAMHDSRVRVIDLTDAFCDPDRCHSLIGGVVVYFDGSHLTATFSRTLGQFIAQRL